MIAHRLILLSKAQREYLSLVHQGLTSKEIAQKLGGSHHTVNVEIAKAMRILGARSRAEAASKIAFAAASSSYEQSYELADIATPSADAAIPAGEEADFSGSGFPLPIPTVRRPTNTLTPWQRVWWILLLAAIVALLVGGLVSGVVAQLDGLAHRF